MQLYKYNYFWFPSWPSVTNKYKLGALPGFMEIPAGSQEDQRHKHFFYLQLYFYLQPGFFSLEKLPFSFGRPFGHFSPFRIFNMAFFVMHAQGRIFSHFCFSSQFWLWKDCAAARVANWRRQFAKFSSRVQIEPNARMLVNNKIKLVQKRKIQSRIKHFRQMMIGNSFKWCGCRPVCLFLNLLLPRRRTEGQAGGGPGGGLVSWAVRWVAPVPRLSVNLPLRLPVPNETLPGRCSCQWWIVRVFVRAPKLPKNPKQKLLPPLENSVMDFQKNWHLGGGGSLWVHLLTMHLCLGVS